MARATVLVACFGVVALSCIAHGIQGGSRARRVLQGMIDQGVVTGKFWQVSEVETHTFTVTRYQRELRIGRPEGAALEPGDNISFVVRRGPEQENWMTERFRVHGMSAWKYLLSFVAVIGVAAACALHMGVDRKHLALTLDPERSRCRTD